MDPNLVGLNYFGLTEPVLLALKWIGGILGLAVSSVIAGNFNTLKKHYGWDELFVRLVSRWRSATPAQGDADKSHDDKTTTALEAATPHAVRPRPAHADPSSAISNHNIGPPTMPTAYVSSTAVAFPGGVRPQNAVAVIPAEATAAAYVAVLEHEADAEVPLTPGIMMAWRARPTWTINEAGALLANVSPLHCKGNEAAHSFAHALCEAAQLGQVPVNDPTVPTLEAITPTTKINPYQVALWAKQRNLPYRHLGIDVA